MLAIGEPEFAMHETHGPLPTANLCVSALHALHVSPLPPVYPELHKQLVLASLASGALECSGHAVHTLSSRPPNVVENLSIPHDVQIPMPEAILYVPATHKVHATPLEAPDDPGLQVHAVNAALPGGASVSNGHP